MSLSRSKKEMKGFVQPQDGQGFGAWQREILSQKSALNGWDCIYAVDLMHVMPESERYIVWLYETFALDVHKLNADEALCVRRMRPCNARLLHTRYGFDVNTPLAGLRDCFSYAEEHLTNDMAFCTQANAKDLVWCGAHPQARMKESTFQVFLRRSRCARACRALNSRLFCPYGASLPRDLREVLARALWENRVEIDWDYNFEYLNK